MTILFVAVRFHSNQVPLARALVDAGHTVVYDVLCIGNSEDHAVVRPNVMPVTWLPKVRMRLARPKNPVAYRAAHAYPSLGWYLRRFRALAPDVVVVRDPNRPYAWRAAVAARLLGKRVVLYTQGAVHANASWRSKWIRSVLMHALDAVWMSPVPGDGRLPKVHPDVHYIPFAADLSRRAKSEWFRGDRVNLLDIGKFVPRKNHALLLRALNELRQNHPVHLTVVGEVSTEVHRACYKSFLASIARYGLEDFVTVRVNVPFGELRAIFEEHDLFVLPSRDEPASVSILEAMSHGLPVVCSTTSGTRWYVDPERTGFVFRSDDLEDLLRTLTVAVEDRRSLIAMGTAGRARAETMFHPESVARDFTDMVHSWRRRP